MTIETFATNCASIWERWILLLSQTHIPAQTTSHDTRFTLAFQVVENLISTTSGVLRWLAYIQLIQLFNTLKKVIKQERSIGIFQRKQGISDDILAINIYFDALEGNLQRQAILERRRIGKRWVLLSKSSPFFLFLYPCIN